MSFIEIKKMFKKQSSIPQVISFLAMLMILNCEIIVPTLYSLPKPVLVHTSSDYPNLTFNGPSESIVLKFDVKFDSDLKHFKV